MAEALDIVAKEKYRRKDSKCFGSARMHILCISGSEAYSSPEGGSVVDDNPCETAAVIFLERRIALVAPYPFSLPDFGRVNYPYPGNYPVIFFITACG